MEYLEELYNDETYKGIFLEHGNEVKAETISQILGSEFDRAFKDLKPKKSA